MDRRTKSRIDLQLTCYIGAGKVQAAPVRTLTENVSRTGMLMRWSAGTPLPSLGGKLVLDVELPENSGFGPRVMRCRAEVIRLTACEGNEHEVALRIASMRFIKGRFDAAPVTEPRKRKSRGKALDLASMPAITDRVI
jgi:c-di-GMP-binding flagellar brake protein YcgR